MELTALPTSLSRESTTPSIGERMVALRRSSSARDTTAACWSYCACAFAMAARALPRFTLAEFSFVQRHLVILLGFIPGVLRDQPLAKQLLRAVEVLLQEGNIGAFRVHFVTFVIGLGASTWACITAKGRARFVQAGEADHSYRVRK